MPAFNKFHCFVEDLSEKVHNLGSDTLKLALADTLPVSATDTTLADISELAGGGGYTAGGETVTVTSSSQSSGVYRLIANDVLFTATTGFGPFRYVVLYNSTAGDKLIGWYDAGSNITLAASQVFQADFDQVNGILSLV